MEAVAGEKKFARRCEDETWRECRGVRGGELAGTGHAVDKVCAAHSTKKTI
jgi:hypothetical protein